MKKLIGLQLALLAFAASAFADTAHFYVNAQWMRPTTSNACERLLTGGTTDKTMWQCDNNEFVWIPLYYPTNVSANSFTVKLFVRSAETDSGKSLCFSAGIDAGVVGGAWEDVDGTYGTAQSGSVASLTSANATNAITISDVVAWDEHNGADCNSITCSGVPMVLLLERENCASNTSEAVDIIGADVEWAVE